MKTSSQPSLPRSRAVPAETGASARRTHPARALRALFVWLAPAALLLLLVACTRDRPIQDIPETPTSAPLEIPAGERQAQPAAPAVEVTSGEPEVESALPVTDGIESGGTGGVEIREYEVQQGDTLLSIAIEFDTTTDELRQLNFLQSDLIQVGQLLRVPMIPPPPTPTPSPFYHVVQTGETLGEIAVRYGVSLIDIMNENRLADANALRAGMELVIPGVAPVAAGAEGDSAAAGEAGATGGQTAVDPNQQGYHTVLAGETLNGIAALYGLPAATIVQSNNIADRNNLRTGTRLLLPGVTAQQVVEANSIRHTVVAGESLSAIARQYGVTVGEIMRANAIANANQVRTGQVLVIPPAQQ